MEDYKNEIDKLIEDNKQKYLSNSYGNDISDLINKMKDLKIFLEHSESFKIESENVDEDIIKSYYLDRLNRVVEDFMNN